MESLYKVSWFAQSVIWYLASDGLYLAAFQDRIFLPQSPSGLSGDFHPWCPDGWGSVGKRLFGLYLGNHEVNKVDTW